MNIADCKPGARVLYQPRLGSEEQFEGVVREEPWEIGGGIFVTHLHQMEPAYGIWRGDPGKTTVHSAVVQHLKLVAPEEPIASTTFFDHMQLENGIVTMDGFIRQAMAMPTEKLKKLHDVERCPESECLICGIILCPHREPLHCHHDGCPACE